jgi:hypothetical protein
VGLDIYILDILHNLTTIYQKTKIILLIQKHLLNFDWMINFDLRVSGSSVGMIMVQFEDSLCQRLEVQISIRSSYSEKIFYEKKNSMIYGPTTTACTPNHLIPI